MVKIDERLIAKSLNINITEIERLLVKLQDLEVIKYIKSHNDSQVTFREIIKESNQINLSEEKIERDKNNTIKKINSMINYTLNHNECRSKLLLSYFGEESNKCEICDYCIEIKNS